mgnify:CR=1 FL=1
MSEHELVMELDRCGVRANPRARAKLAKDLSERGVLRADIALAYQHLVERRDNQPARAASILATLLADDGAWQGFITEVHTAQARGHGKAPEHESGKGLRSSPHEQRVREYRAAGLDDAEARMVAAGGYAHARIVGDGAKPADVAKEVGLDPFEVIHAAAHWADLFGQGRAALRKALERAIRVGLAADSLLEELEHCAVRVLGGDRPTPILTGWRARAAPRPSRPRQEPVQVAGDPSAARELLSLRARTKAVLAKVTPAREPVPAADSVWDVPVFGEVVR